MCSGLAILRDKLTDSLILRHQLGWRLHDRSLDNSGRFEARFMFAERRPLLPVIHDGQLVIYEWGMTFEKQRKSFRVGYCKEESLQAGSWRYLKPVPIVIPADFGFEKGVWFNIVQGIRGVVIRDDLGKPHAFILTQPSTRYYEMMTKRNREPVLVEQII